MSSRTTGLIEQIEINPIWRCNRQSSTLQILRVVRNGRTTELQIPLWTEAGCQSVAFSRILLTSCRAVGCAIPYCRILHGVPIGMARAFLCVRQRSTRLTNTTQKSLSPPSFVPQRMTVGRDELRHIFPPARGVGLLPSPDPTPLSPPQGRWDPRIPSALFLSLLLQVTRSRRAKSAPHTLAVSPLSLLSAFRRCSHRSLARILIDSPPPFDLRSAREAVGLKRAIVRLTTASMKLRRILVR